MADPPATAESARGAADPARGSAGPARGSADPARGSAAGPERSGWRVVLSWLDRHPLLVTVVAAVGLAGAWLAAPPMGTDLSAQVARADFFAAHGWAPIDFRWYGGVLPYGYSLVTPPLMAWFGVRPVGAAAAVVSALALVGLLRRTGVPRPLLGGVLGAVGFVGNLVSGRVTFAVGVAIGLLALLVLAPRLGAARRIRGAAGPPSPPSDSRELVGSERLTPSRGIGRYAGSYGIGRYAGSYGIGRYAGAGALAVLAAAASPVAGLFVGLAGTAALLGTTLQAPPSRDDHEQTDRHARRVGQFAHDRREGVARRSWVAGGVVLTVGAAVPLAVMAGLFGSGGTMNMSRDDLVHAAVASLAVAVLVPHRVIRIGALLSAAGVVAAYALPTPVGLNATRLVTMFALPVVAACATLPEWLRGRVPRWLAKPAVWLVVVLALLAWWQPPVLDRDLARAGDPTASAEFFAPLEQELASREPVGRVEVVPTVNYWESAYVDAAPLARGWLRQIDLDRNPQFFDGTLDAASYREWLERTGVSHVALTTAGVSWIGRAEAELIRSGLPYLIPVWENQDWTLYEVAGAPTIVEGPAELRAAPADAVVFQAAGPGEILLRVRWSRWLAIEGPGQACLAPAGDWVTVQVTQPGEYRVTGSLIAPGSSC